MYSYRIPDGIGHTGGNAAVAAHPIAKRLAAFGPWQTSKHAEGGVLLSWVGGSTDVAMYGTPRATYDGLTFYPSLTPIRPENVARASVSESVDIDLVSGVRLSIPIAKRSARRRRFGCDDALGAFVDEYPTLAFKLFDRFADKEQVTIGDADLRRILFLAVAKNYRMTEEALDDSGWLTTEDDDAIISAAFGTDPKPVPAAGATS